jgi:hypothetical protein
LCFSNIASKSINQNSVGRSTHSNRASNSNRAARSNGCRTPSTVTFIVGSPTFSQPTAPFALKTKPQLSPYIQTSAAPNAARQSIPRSTITYDVGVSTLFCQATVTAKT